MALAAATQLVGGARSALGRLAARLGRDEFDDWIRRGAQITARVEETENRIHVEQTRAGRTQIQEQLTPVQTLQVTLPTYFLYHCHVVNDKFNDF